MADKIIDETNARTAYQGDGSRVLRKTPMPIKTAIEIAATAQDPKRKIDFMCAILACANFSLVA